MRVVVTGGAGFIGSAVIRYLINETEAEVVNVDKLSYASSLEALAEVSESPRYHFERIDICDAPAVARLFDTWQPDAVMHLAAESHVDRSIDGPAAFLQSNVVGTFTLLEAARRHVAALGGNGRGGFRFHHVSTDEVYGSLGATGMSTEDSAYRPNSPYSATKAAADHLVRAWHKTYGLPVVTSNCSNNYGPYQFPEKLIPLLIVRALAGRSLPVYGTGSNVRDWLHVEDHARALHTILTRGKVGEVYNAGADTEKTNIEVVKMVCRFLDELVPDSPSRPHENLIRFVDDRPGHDERYAMDASKLRRELGWRPRQSFEAGLRATVEWYLDNRDWWEPIVARTRGTERLGLGHQSRGDS